MSVLCAVVLTLTAFTPVLAKEAKKSPSLSVTEQTIVIGKTVAIKVKDKITGSKYTWESLNKKVATVSKDGVVTGVGDGKTVISCNIKVANGEYRLQANVTVLKPAARITISNPVKSLNVGDYYKLKTTITPKSATDTVTWTSSDSAIAKVDKDGSFVVTKTGTVTIKATTYSGRSDSVTIQVLGDGEKATTDTEKKETKESKKEEGKDDVKVLKTVLKEDFEKSLGSFTGRTADVSHATAGLAAEGKGYMKVSGRTSNWNGAIVDMTKLVTPGATYRVTGWVRYTNGADVEVIKVTQERTSKEDNKWPPISGNVEVKKGTWTKISGIMEVTPSTTQCAVYLEADSLIDFFVDNVVIEQIDAAPIQEVKVEVKKAKVGDVVYKNDFEDGSVLDSRGSSERKNTTAQAKSGKASVEVKRTAGWDGAGIRFTADNNIVKASYFDNTIRFRAYVMYKDGPDEVQFKLNNRMEKADNSDNILLQQAVKKGEWTLLEAEGLIAKDCEGNMIFIETVDNGALTFYIDNVEIIVVK